MRRKDYERKASYEEDEYRQIHFVVDPVLRVCRRESRCRLGLERDCGRYGRRQPPESICAGALCGHRAGAVFEAVNAVAGHYQPYLGTITAPPGASADAAAVQAAYHVLITYFPASSGTLNIDYENSMAQIPDGQAKQDGIATGDAAAAAMIALRANDGSSPPQFKVPGAPNPGEWQATASCPIVNGVA